MDLLDGRQRQLTEQLALTEINVATGTFSRVEFGRILRPESPLPDWRRESAGTCPV